MITPRHLLAALCVASLGFSTPLLRAEDTPAAGEKEHQPKGNPGDMLKAKLGLTDAQAEQMKAVHQETAAKMKALKDNSSLSMEAKKAERKKIREATKAKIATILTPEQMAQFEKLREEMHSRAGGKGPGPGAKGAKGEKGAKSETSE